MSVETPKLSERFCSTDSDITLQSCDGVHFKVHRVNLKMHSDIFADAEAISTSSEPSDVAKPELVSLSETSTVLDILLQYMYRQPPPDLTEIDFPTLAAVAEASEKYRVFFAIDGCKRAMRDAISDHPFQVLSWAVKHKHPKLIDEAAVRTIGMPTQNMQDALAPAIQGPWVMSRYYWWSQYSQFLSKIEYHKHWLDALNYEYSRHQPTTMHWNNASRETDIACEAWTHSYALITHRLAAKPELLLKPQEVFGKSEDYLQTRCGECKETVVNWRRDLSRELETIPRFSTLV